MNTLSRNIFTAALLTVFVFSVSAQEKGFRGGLKIAGALNWVKPDDAKKFEKGGMVAKGAYGLACEFRLTNVISIATGVNIAYGGGKLNFKDSAYYFISQDELIVSSDTAGKKYDQYRLTSRDYKVTYITIPLTMKMKTKEIGMMTYYGEFGVNTSIKAKAKANDNVLSAKTGGSANQTALDVSSDVMPVVFQLNVGAGAEYNLSGSTSLVFGLNFLNGFSNMLQKESDFIQKGIKDKTLITQKVSPKAFVLTIGVLF